MINTHIGVTSLQRIRNPRQHLVAEDGRFPWRNPWDCGEQLEGGRGNNSWELGRWSG